MDDRVRRWQLDNPEAYEAKIEVGKALRFGRLMRPTVCQRCHTQTRVVALQRDYERPLAIEWVCYLCRYRMQCEAEDAPVPLHRRPSGRPPTPRDATPIEYPFCAAWTTKGPCSFRGRYTLPDGLLYCGHHRRYGLK